MVFEGNYYPHYNLKDLPDELHVSNARTRNTPTFVAYHSSEAPFSNMFLCEIEENGIVFQSVEQAVAHSKAQYAGALEKAQDIRDTHCPYKAKSIAKGIICPTWDARAELEVEKYNLLKYEQHIWLAELLVKSENKRLLEVTPDRKWGCNAGIGSRKLKDGNFNGDNRGGVILERVRCEVRRTFGLSPIRSGTPPPHPPQSGLNNHSNLLAQDARTMGMGPHRH